MRKLGFLVLLCSVIPCTAQQKFPVQISADVGYGVYYFTKLTHSIYGEERNVRCLNSSTLFFSCNARLAKPRFHVDAGLRIIVRNYEMTFFRIAEYYMLHGGYTYSAQENLKGHQLWVSCPLNFTWNIVQKEKWSLGLSTTVMGAYRLREVVQHASYPEYSLDHLKAYYVVVGCGPEFQFAPSKESDIRIEIRSQLEYVAVQSPEMVFPLAGNAQFGLVFPLHAKKDL